MEDSKHRNSAFLLQTLSNGFLIHGKLIEIRKIDRTRWSYSRWRARLKSSN